MNPYLHIHTPDLSDQEKYSTLKKIIDEERLKALNKRLKEEAIMTDMEYKLGAFLEMYEPYLKDVVFMLFEKGYAIETSSGFGNLKSQYQSLDGHFSLDYITRNKLEKEGIRVRDNDGIKSLVFWADKLDLDLIKHKWLRIIEILPDKGKLTVPSESTKAILFRRKYVSRNPKHQRQRLFERLEDKAKKTVEKDVNRRNKLNPRPSQMESRLGIFVEELEPQVRKAVVEMNRKGYSTDLSGFVNNSSEQMIEGDFQLEAHITKKLQLLGIKVETNPSGYTRLRFSPLEADLKKIKDLWNKAVSQLPNRNQIATSSMTRKARDFRMKY